MMLTDAPVRSVTLWCGRRVRTGSTHSAILAAVAILAALHSIAAQAAEKPDPPYNVLFILADQYRADCIGAAGNPRIRTPNLDRLAREGMRFTHAYAAQPVCSPNRASIITGLYPHSAGVQENNVPLPKTSRTMSEMLEPAGYDCGYFGKWHLGRRDAFKTFPVYPNDGRGDNHYFGKGDARRYGVDVITEDAIRFIRQKRTTPFYVYVSYYPPHPPFSVPNEYVEPYKDIADRDMRIYYAMCTKVDEKVGELLKTIGDMGIADRTLVVFTSDHGHNFELRWNRHHKRLCYDTSSRIPLLMRLPGVIPAGRDTGALISSVDLTPTILSLLGRPVPSGLQGQDLSALARGTTDRGRDYVFIENIPFTDAPAKGEERCVFDGRWKLILSTQRPPELYDLADDPKEVHNRWAEMKGSSVVRTLLDRLAAWAGGTRDDLAPRLTKRASAQVHGAEKPEE